MERIIRKCMEKDSTRRYQSARELLVDLKNFRRDTSSVPSGVSVPVAAPTSPRRFMVAATIAVAVQLSAPWVTQRQRKELKKQVLSDQKNDGAVVA